MSFGIAGVAGTDTVRSGSFASSTAADFDCSSGFDFDSDSDFELDPEYTSTPEIATESYQRTWAAEAPRA